MELVKVIIWMFGRWEEWGDGELFICLSAYSTQEEAVEKLIDHKGCKGEFDVVETESWMPQ